MTASHANWSQQQRRKDLVWAALALAVLGCLAVMALWVQGVAQDRDALARQVQDLGGTPVAGPPGLRGEPGEGATGPAGERGEKGEKGDPGSSAPTLSPSPGASGASGAPGRPGVDSTVPGPSGAPGADSTVPGPSGAPGVAGRDGTNGTDGADGTDGKPPAGWTWEQGGRSYECRPVDGFDPDAPRYACSPSDPGPEDPDVPQAAGAALDPRRTQYV